MLMFGATKLIYNQTEKCKIQICDILRMAFILGLNLFLIELINQSMYYKC